MPDALEKFLIGELTTPVHPDVVAFADALALACPQVPLGVLFYGSVLRTEDFEGILDFYIVTEDASGFTGGLISRTGNLLLPPNVRYAEFKVGQRILRAKIAVLSQQQFKERTTLGTLDTTLWARFCQPVRLIWVRNAKAADMLLDLIARCVTTASCWAALLGQPGMTAVEYWQSLFARTYASELRVEKKGRGHSLIAGQEERFAAMLPLGWARAHLRYSATGDRLEPVLSFSARKRAARRWALVGQIGKPRNVARLVKAAFTFENGASYLAWKIQRHTGLDLNLSEAERNHPLLFLPILLKRMQRLRKQSQTQN
ncbi:MULTISPECIES: hypothetical protein [Gluconobacter]|uniref:hypothetical protein n=1 Tax=Gluconobacter japonicus TaxID=376620 RepID=UPI00029A0C86